MGGADVIPGVSGGTMALITGIYEELIDSIRSIDATALKLLLGFQIAALWRHINGSFLVNVFAGVLISIFSLAKLITFLLENHPIPVWSFFFGLILISAFYVLPRQRDWRAYIFLVVGVVIAYTITSLAPAETPTALWFIFLSGAIAICAMILPGISGSFILLLLGKYEYVLGAVKSFDLGVIVVFALGCAIGIVTFSKLIHWLLHHQKVATLSILAGFMLGSLNKIWPWKLVEENSFVNLSPQQFELITGQPNQLSFAIICAVAGVVIVVALERFGSKMS
ncbi:putative membrane protein [Marinoscillum furvescens DSM 4134]|uniref:Putative membrane protein n=2 Tax=Marinoscillum furvescens TaxID=1026 RepID=A0A3D9KXT7_MARFU|nr:putative membrane protein [Marinoscillum furvescens DSM 4134]